MTGDHWRRIREVFDQVLDYPAEERTAVLARLTAGDADVRREVEDLLAALDDADARLVDAELARPRFADAVEDLAGTNIGPYRLERRIGRGGMGDVYLAQRSDGQFTRSVAIKLIKAGMDTAVVVQRFRQERQILAALSHPNVAALLDGGVTEMGRPYFVMEYVAGEPITDWCVRNDLSIAARVRLFRDVCSAVHFAHQNLVIHRDLKPANILVTPEGIVKLLDFGVAKLTSPGGEEHQTLTALGGRALTPSYASPEQIRGEPVTTATDVYSLGVILYELLAGRRPFALESVSLAEAMRVLSTEEPTRPSAALADEPTLPARREDRRALRRGLEGDLDNIVLKAIRKEPLRRYSSAHELGEDLRRFLEGRPVTARSDTFGYRLGKFVKRHRAGVAMASVLLVATLLGVGGTVTQAQRAAVQQARALERLHNVRDLANTLLFEVHDAVAELPGATEARRLILERGFQNLEKLAADFRGDATIEWELAEAYLRMGIVLGQPAGASLGDLDAATTSYSRAIEIAGALQDRNPRDVRARRTLSLAHEKMGDALSWSGSLEEGVEHARKALALNRAIAQADPDSGRYQLSVAISLIKLGDLTGHPVFPNLGRPGESIEHYDAARAILGAPPLAEKPAWNVRRYRALIDERLGGIHRALGRFHEARIAFARSLAERERLAREQPANMDALRDVGVTQQNLCEVDRALGQEARGLPLCRAALTVFEQLTESDPSNTQASSDVARGSVSFAGVLHATGDVGGALEAYERAIALFRASVVAQPDNVPNRLMLARAMAAHSMAAAGAGRSQPFAADAYAALSALRDSSQTAPGDDATIEWLRERTLD